MYPTNLANIYLIMILGVLLWSTLQFGLYKNKQRRTFWKSVSFIGFLISFYGIISYTVLHRTPSANHEFVFFAPYTNEFYREMLINAFLSLPFGLTLSTLLSSAHLMGSGENKNDVKRIKDQNGKAIGPWAILIGFLISASIESWQYFAGTGLVQGTNVIMNMLGAAIGTIPWFIVRCGVVEKNRKQYLRISHRRTTR